LGADTVNANSTLEVSGSGYLPDESVELSLHSDPIVLDTITADATGSFQTTVTLPSAVSGSHTVWATGQESGLILRSALTIQADEFLSPAPTIAGDLQVGGTVSAVTDGWSDGTSFTYQWLREGKAISGATAESYT